MDSFNDFSLNTPNNFNDNILNKKIFSLIKNDKMYGGGNTNNTNCFTLIIGIIIIIIGFILCWFKNDWIGIKADIMNISCTNQNEIANSIIKFNDCNVSIKYKVNTIEYSKIIIMNKLDIPAEKSIKIYCLESDPNTIRLYNFNYSVMGIILILFGAFILASSISCSKPEIDSLNLDSE